MGIVKGQKQVVRQTWVGLTNLTPVKFNPTAAELSEIYGREVNKEPEYIRENGVSIRLVASFPTPKGEQFVNLQIASLKNEPYVSKSGKIRVLTGNALSFNGESVEAITSNANLGWADFSNVREARFGETELYSWLTLWASYNNRSEEDFILDEEIWEELASGDVSFLNDLIENEEEGLKGYVIPMVLTEKDGYQDFCPFFPYSSGNVSGVIKQLKKKEAEGYPYLGNCNWDLKLGKVEAYDPNTHVTFGEYLRATENIEVSSDEGETTMVSGGFV